MTAGATLEDRLARHLEELCVAIGERTVTRRGSLDRAAGYIEAAFAGAGLEVSAQSYEYFGHRVTNLVAGVPGAGSPRYLVGAHYDTVPGTPGADDNASGVAALIEAARLWARRGPTGPVGFVAFTLEEPPAFMTGHQGSRVFTRQLARDDAPAGAIVLEMVGYTSPRQAYPAVLKWAGYPEAGDYIGIVGNWRSRRLTRRLKRTFGKNPRLPVESLTVPFNGWVLPSTRLSDHASFWDRGWPAVMVTDTAFFRNPHYHTATDRPETLDLPFLAQVVRSLDLGLAELTGAS